MVQRLRLTIVLLAACVANAATLVQLSLDDLNQKATAVVRARVTGVSVSATGSTVYTHYQLSTVEVLKGQALPEVMLPGGQYGRLKQDFPGVPELKVGTEYVLFLWVSPSTGAIHPLGLTQGIFETSTLPDGTVVAARNASGEAMLDATGQRIADQSVSLKLADLRSRLRSFGR